MTVPCVGGAGSAEFGICVPPTSMPSRGCPQYHSSNGPLLGLASRSVSVPTLCSGPPRALHLHSADMGTLASPREQLGALHPLLVASGVQLNHKARDKSDVSCCDNREWPRSTSPAHSTHSGNSSLPSEEVVDSGVCSEHDTPPLTVRCQASRSPLHRQATSDSDCESNLSSDSLPDQCRGSRRWTPPRRAARPGGGKLTLPEALLQEIKEKWQELQHRRQQLGRVDVPERGGCGQLGTRAVASQWSAGRHAHHRRSSCPASPVLSRASSLSFPSSFSLFDEELESPRSSPVYLEGWRLMGVQRPCDHVGARALYECRDEEAGQGFAGIRDIFSPQQDSTIKSCKGTVRGVKNRVRAGIATFTTDQRITKYFMERERGKVVVYLTTLGIVRDTYERCLRIRKILWTLLVRFEERDVFMARDTQLQLLDRLHSSNVSVPHVFLEGQYLGDAEQIERLNECGELRRLLQPYRRACQVSPCDTCGGFRLLPCSVCNGSKKSVHRNDFTLEFVALKCSSCDESGLVRCGECAEDKDGLERPA